MAFREIEAQVVLLKRKVSDTVTVVRIEASVLNSPGVVRCTAITNTAMAEKSSVATYFTRPV